MRTIVDAAAEFVLAVERVFAVPPRVLDGSRAVQIGDLKLSLEAGERELWLIRMHALALEERAGLRARAVADAVVAGEVRRRLGGSDQVVAGEPVLDGLRQRTLTHFGAERLELRDRGAHGVPHAGLDALGLVQLARDTDAEAAKVLS